MTDKSITFILSLNGGASSLKFNLYHSASTKLESAGSIDRIGEEKAHFEIKDMPEIVNWKWDAGALSI